MFLSVVAVLLVKVGKGSLAAVLLMPRVPCLDLVLIEGAVTSVEGAVTSVEATVTWLRVP